MDNNSDDDKVVLSAFKYNCRKCGIKGHIAKDCYKKGNNRKKFKN